jgi:hypothetical protein
VLGRPGPAQGRRQHRLHQRGPAQFGDEQPLRVPDQPVRLARPDLPRRQQEARIGRRPQEELQLPLGAVAGLVVGIVRGRLTQGADFGQPETRPAVDDSGIGGLGDLVPLRDGAGQDTELVQRKLEAGIAAPQSGQPRPGRTPAPAQLDGRIGPCQPVPDRRVGQGVEGIGDERARRGPGARRALFGPPDRRHRRDQRVERDEIHALEHRAPPGLRRIAPAEKRRQHPPAPHQLRGQAGHRPQVGDRSAVRGRVVEVVELGGVHEQRRHRPRPQRRHPPSTFRRRLGGSERPVRQRGQQQRRRRRLAGVQRGQLRAGDRERVREREVRRPARRAGRASVVLRPEQQTPARGPQGVHRGQGLGLLRPIRVPRRSSHGGPRRSPPAPADHARGLPASPEHEKDHEGQSNRKWAK